MATIAILLICIVGLMLALSPGKPKPYTDQNGKPLAGSLSEKVFLDIGGLRQGMFIKSKDTTNPALLLLHGGIPFYFLGQKYPTGLDNHFTVVWWEQRGSGLSFSPDIPPETLTLEQMINDALEVTDYLRARFGQDKLYLMAHSGGTFIGIQLATRAPERYHAYIGVAQIVDQLQSERLARDYMIGQYQERGNEKMVKQLTAASLTEGTPDTYLKVRDKAMHELGIGTMHEMKSVISGIFLPSLACRDYTLAEKARLWRGKFHSGVSSLWNEILATNLMDEVPELHIPVYLFVGKYDYTVSTTLTREYFEHLKAPLKGFYTFEKSAHSPIFEEPEKVQRIIREDVLRGGNELADLR